MFTPFRFHQNEIAGAAKDERSKHVLSNVAVPPLLLIGLEVSKYTYLPPPVISSLGPVNPELPEPVVKSSTLKVNPVVVGHKVLLKEQVDEAHQEVLEEYKAKKLLELLNEKAKTLV